MFLKKLLLALMLVSMTTPAYAITFTDVNGTGYEDAFAYLSEKDIVHGYANGQAKPHGYLNRAEAVKVIVTLQTENKKRVEWYQKNMPTMTLFRDVQSTDWFAPYIEVAFEKRIATGYNDGTFHPERLLSAEEAVTLLMRTYGDIGDTGVATQSLYIQNRPNEWFTPFVNAAIRRNLVSHKNKLQLGTAIKRGEFFEMVYRMHSIKASGVVAFIEPVGSIAQQPAPVQQVAVAPQHIITAPQPQATSLVYQPTINAPQPIAVTNIAANHQYASEKYFSITIPAAGITDLNITHPTDAFSKEGVLAPLQSGVGHLFSYPGNGGKIMVYGHSSGYPWDVSQYTKIFRKINELKAGDRIYVTYSGTMYVYEVTFEEAIPAADTSRFTDNGTGEELILYTCWPPDSITQRYLVHAVPVQTIALQ